MARPKKEAAEQPAGVSFEQEITDVLVEFFRNADGDEKMRRTFMAGETKLGEEVVNA